MLEEKMHKADGMDIRITKLRVQCIRFNEKFQVSDSVTYVIDPDSSKTP